MNEYKKILFMTVGCTIIPIGNKRGQRGRRSGLIKPPGTIDVEGRKRSFDLPGRGSFFVLAVTQSQKNILPQVAGAAIYVLAALSDCGLHGIQRGYRHYEPVRDAGLISENEQRGCKQDERDHRTGGLRAHIAAGSELDLLCV